MPDAAFGNRPDTLAADIPAGGKTSARAPRGGLPPASDAQPPHPPGRIPGVEVARPIREVGLGDLALIADVRKVLFAAARVVIRATEEENTGRDCPAIATGAARQRDLALVPVVEIGGRLSRCPDSQARPGPFVTRPMISAAALKLFASRFFVMANAIPVAASPKAKLPPTPPTPNAVCVS